MSVRRPSPRRPCPHQAGPADRGSGTVLVLIVMMVLCTAGGSGALVAAAIGVRHSAETAADLAALSAAAAAQRGALSPCAIAGGIANANGATLATCRNDGGRVTLSVTVQPRGALSRLPPVHGRARAGPVSAPPAG